MSYLKRSYPPEIVDKMVYDFLDLNYRLVDISHKYEVNYQTLRHLLLSRFDSENLLQYRRTYREKKLGLKGHGSITTRKSKTIPIVIDLINDKEMSYADIARKNEVSRERVGQIAEICAEHGHNVSRGNTRITRGVAA